MVSQLRRALVSVVPKPAMFSLHSLRSGGATCAAAVSREELQRLDRWASAAVDSYIEPSLDSRLKITREIATL
jgi:hypothetical protein